MVTDSVENLNERDVAKLELRDAERGGICRAEFTFWSKPEIITFTCNRLLRLADNEVNSLAGWVNLRVKFTRTHTEFIDRLLDGDVNHLNLWKDNGLQLIANVLPFLLRPCGEADNLIFITTICLHS